MGTSPRSTALLTGADALPTDQVERAVVGLQVDLELTLNLTKSFTQAFMPSLNRRLTSAGLPAVSLSAREPLQGEVGSGEGDDEP